MMTKMKSQMKNIISFITLTLLLFGFLSVFHFFPSFVSPASASSVSVAQSTDTSATAAPPQLKLFHDNLTNGCWWCFYDNGTYMCYVTSQDQTTWSSPTAVIALGGDSPYINATGSDFEVGYNPSYDASCVYYAVVTVYSSSCALFFCRGIISGDHVIWGTVYKVTTSVQTYYWAYPNVAVMDNGTVLAACNYGSLGNVNYYVYSDPSNDGSGAWTQQFSSLAAMGSGYWISGTIQILSSGQILSVYSETYASPYLRYNYYDGSAGGWSGDKNVATGTPTQQFFGAVSWENYTLISYVTSTGLMWQLFNATSASWYGENPVCSTRSPISVGEISYNGVTGHCCIGFVNATGGWYIYDSVWYGVSHACSSPTLLESDILELLNSQNTIVQSPITYERLGIAGWGLGWTGYINRRVMFDLISAPSSSLVYTFPSPSYSTIQPYTTCTFSVLWTDIGGHSLSMAFYSTNISGRWVYNQTVTLSAVNSSSAWANWTGTLPPLESVTCYYWICNDSLGNWCVSMPNQTVTSMISFNVTALGTTTCNEYGAGSSVDAALFDGCLLFWRYSANGYYDLTAFNLTSGTFSDVYTSQGQNWPARSSPACENGGFVIDDTFYTGYSWQNDGPPYFTSTVICTSDLATFTTLGNVSMALESICDYTGGGAYNGTVYFGGFQSIGYGTYSQIDRWYGGTDQLVWAGTILGSDDVCFLTMFNSTCMIGSDCAPNNIIYTNDGENFVDEWNPQGVPFYTSQYPFVWAWGCYVDSTSGTAYIAAPASPFGANYYGDYSGGMATWTGAGTYTATSWDPVNLYTVSNDLVGGSDNLLNNNGFTGSPAIYTYNSAGSKVDEVWHNSSDTGAVLSLVYDAAERVWYGLYYDTLSKNVTVASIAAEAVSAGSPTIYIDGNGSVFPSCAPVSSADNVTYTLIDSMSYPAYSGIIIDRSNIVIDGDGYTVQGDGSYSLNGLSLAGVSNVTIENTSVTGFQFGIRLSSSNNNTVSGNNVTANGVGICIDNSSNNIVYHNNFIGNNASALIDSTSFGNAWNATYPFGGNYWSDYDGSDVYSGPYQNVTGSDGIGDTPYVIDTNNTDNYPLMGPFLSLGGISVVSNSTISDFQNFADSYVLFDVSGPADTTGFCTLTIPYSAMLPSYILLVDGQQLPFTTIKDDGTVSVIYFAYQHSTNEVMIIPAGGGGGCPGRISSSCVCYCF
jgi:parallel beta-helix repeat protein